MSKKSLWKQNEEIYLEQMNTLGRIKGMLCGKMHAEEDYAYHIGVLVGESMAHYKLPMDVTTINTWFSSCGLPLPIDPYAVRYVLSYIASGKYSTATKSGRGIKR